ncbi:unnamed protein product [Dimorphilus gyrociliatus]|nr:unnamed protein product [Dimorphilus gyrociliatus]
MRSSSTKKIDKSLTDIIKDTPDMTNAGSNCQVIIDTETIQLISLDNQRSIGLYPLNSVSFTSSGDNDLDFVTIVSKDVIRGRFCHILECGNKSSHDILNTLGQAFELRYKQFLGLAMIDSRAVGNCYVAEPSAPPLTNEVDEDKGNDNNDHKPTETPTEVVHNSTDDFGMEPFTLEGCIGAGDPTNEEWFHGNISRSQAEELLKEDGDFLVRLTSNCIGQYVLSGKHNHTVRHLLLVDPNGIVRTKTQAFNSISHLIRHYVTSGNPIHTKDGLFVLKRPVALANC